MNKPKSFEEVQTYLNQIESRLAKFETQNIDLHKRRVINATDAVDAGDYITLQQLKNTVSKDIANIPNPQPVVFNQDNNLVTFKGPNVPFAQIDTSEFKGTRLDVRMFGAKGDGVTDDTLAFQKAINTLGALTYINPFINATRVQGGGKVIVPRGKYLITDTLKYPSACEIEGEGGGLAAMLVFSPVSNKPLITSDYISKPAQGATVRGFRMKNLAFVAGNSFAQDGLYLTNTDRINLVGLYGYGFSRHGIWIGQQIAGASASYYNFIEQCEVYNCVNDLWLDDLANATQIISGHFWHDATYALADYTVTVRCASASFFGTTFEGRPNIAQVHDLGTGTTFVGNYTETIAGSPGNTRPFIRRNMSNAYNKYANTSVFGPLSQHIMFENFAETVSDPEAVSPRYPTKFDVGNPKFVPLLINGNTDTGMSPWAQSGFFNHGIVAWDATTKFLSNGSLKLVNDGTGGFNSAFQTIPAASLVPYVGRRIYFTLCYNVDANAQTIQLRVAGAGNSLQKFSTPGGVEVSNFENSWKMFEIDFPIISAADMTFNFESSSAIAGATMWFTHAYAFLDGYESIPVNRSVITSVALDRYFLPLIVNGNFQHGLYHWNQSFTQNHGTVAYDTTTTFESNGSILLTHDGSGLVNALNYTANIPQTQLANHVGKTLHFEITIKTDANVQSILPRFAFTTNIFFFPTFLYSNGWVKYEVDILIVAGFDLQFSVGQTSSVVGAKCWIDHAYFFANFFETLPLNLSATPYFDTAIPTAGAWIIGDIVINSNPTVGSPYGWRCTTAGSPGTWETLTAVALANTGTAGTYVKTTFDAFGRETSGVAGPLAVSDGGTGAVNIATARANLIAAFKQTVTAYAGGAASATYSQAQIAAIITSVNNLIAAFSI